MGKRVRKTPQMRRVEDERGESIESLIRAAYNQGCTREEIARDLGVSRTTFHYWLTLLGAEFMLSFASEQDPVTAG